jgi:hypothetical protein
MLVSNDIEEISEFDEVLKIKIWYSVAVTPMAIKGLKPFESKR